MKQTPYSPEEISMTTDDCWQVMASLGDWMEGRH